MNNQPKRQPQQEPEFLLDKPLPSSPDAERQVLGAVLLDNNTMDVAQGILKPEDFYSPLNKAVFDIMQELRRELMPISPLHIYEKIKGRGLNDGMHRITDLTYGMPHYDTKSMATVCRIVKNKSVARSLIKACAKITSDCLADDDDVTVVLEQAECIVLAIVNDLHTNSGSAPIGFSSLSELGPGMQAQFEAYNRGETNGVSTGMKEVDEKLDGGGLQKQGVYLVAASEKAGKTSLALDWGYDVSMVQGHTTLISTGEMNKTTLAKRIYSAHTGIPFFMFRPGFSDSKEYKAYTNAISGLKDFGKIPIRIADKLRTMSQIRRHFLREIEKGLKTGGVPVELGIIDYLQLIELDGADNNKNRAEVVSRISREIKLLASEADIPLIVMSSLNRVGLTEGQRPDTMNLRESQQLAFDAEAVFFLHNPAYVPGKAYTPQEVTPIDLILARQRNGPTGDIALRFIGPYMQFMTDTQYARHLGDTNTDNPVPKSTGQVIQEKEDLSSLWE